MELDDRNILEAMRKDLQSEFEMMFRSLYKPLCIHAYSLLRSKEEAEEIVQSVFIQLWDKRNTLEIESSFKSYLYRAVRNQCLNVLKHEKVKKRHAEYAATAGAGASESSSQQLGASELEDRIAAAMLKLPPQCRIVFQMSRMQELKYAEIATELNISIKTVENQMGKALRIMREELMEFLPLFLILLEGIL